MKSFIAAKMSSMRKRSTLSSSAGSSAEVTTTRGVITAGDVPKEPSSHHGKMRLFLNGIDPSTSFDASEELLDIILCVAVDSLHAVTDIDSSIVFEADFVSIKEIVWDHTECSLCFVLENGLTSPSFVFVSTLVELEAQLTSALRSSGQRRLPDQVYVGVLVGRNLPSSPIHQRRASLTGFGAQQLPSLPAPLRRELLAHERPPRSISPRDKLAFQYFRSGILSFPCSINGDARGLKLDGNFLYVFPSPDCHDRSACLFSYQYEQVDTCEVRGGVRLELRFRRSGAKQPTFIAFQSPDAQYIRDAIWYFQYDVPMDEYFRRTLNSEMGSVSEATGIPKSALLPRPPLGRRNSLKAFQDDQALKNRIQSRCVVVGCTRRCGDLASATVHDCAEVGANGIVRRRKIWLCEEHAPVATEPGSPPRSPSKRSGLLSRGKSAVLTPLLIHSKHYQQSVKYHGTLLKSSGKYQLMKSWNQKIVALIDTPLGGFLCYYDKLAHCPGQSESTPKERRIVDLSGVICVRREGIATTGSQRQPFAFDIVTVYRSWTFAASDLQEYEVWLSVLGGAIERQSSMSPDRPLRFPVKCLRDPLHNLPSRNDGTTALEVSSNGVTVCSGTDGDSEVYNWYFTDIQKWSVAKQHDNSACCFISCAVGPVGPTTPNSAASMRYQDFLFQTPEAEAICSAIEFFVGRCMAKLEVLGLLYMHAQQRQSSRRPSLEPASQKPSSSTTADEKHAKANCTKEHTLAVVPLRPVGLVPIASDSECIQQTALEGPRSPSQRDENKIETSDNSPLPAAMCAVTMSKESSATVKDVSESPRPPPVPVESRTVELISSFAVAGTVTVVEQSPCEVQVDEVQFPTSIISTRSSSSDSTNDGAPLESGFSQTPPPDQDKERESKDEGHLQREFLPNAGRGDSSSPSTSEKISDDLGDGDADCDSKSPSVAEDIADAPVESDADDDETTASATPNIANAPRVEGDADDDTENLSTLQAISDVRVKLTIDAQTNSLSASHLITDTSVEGHADGDKTTRSPLQQIAVASLEGDADDDSASLSLSRYMRDLHVKADAEGPSSSLSASQNIEDVLVEGEVDGDPDSLSTSRDVRDLDFLGNADGDSNSLSASEPVSDVVVEGGETPAHDSLQEDLPQTDLTSHLLLLNEEPSITLWPDGLNNYSLEEQTDADSDRFVSFQYCDCTVGVVEDTSSVDEQEVGEVDDGAREEEAFEDARCDLLDILDTAENSVVILDGCSGNDEDSLVVLEDEETNCHDIDAIGDFASVHDPVDELRTAYEGEGSQVEEMFARSTEMIDSTEHEVYDGNMILIPS